MATEIIRRHGLRFKFWGIYVFVFGTADLHSHIRLRAIRKHFGRCSQAIELGAGRGGMGVAFANETNSPCILVPHTREEADRLRQSLAAAPERAHLDILVADAEKPFLKAGAVDLVLMIDVLEHVKDDNVAIRSIHGYLRKGGTLLLSVPTPEYPRYFGDEFDARIGHLRHYTPTTVFAVLERNGFEVVDWEYYTRPFAAALCRIWYQKLPRGSDGARLGQVLATPLFAFLCWLGENRPNRSDSRSASIAVVARRLNFLD